MGKEISPHIIFSPHPPQLYQLRHTLKILKLCPNHLGGGYLWGKTKKEFASPPHKLSPKDTTLGRKFLSTPPSKNGGKEFPPKKLKPKRDPIKGGFKKGDPLDNPWKGKNALREGEGNP